MSHVRLLLAVASALVLTACAPAAKYWASAPAPAPPPTVDSAASAQSVSADGVQTSNASSRQQAPTIPGPDGAIWLKPDAASETYRIDADSCYSFARAQNAHDARIESDSNAAFRDSTSGFGQIQLRQRMNQYARTNRLPRLFGQCMEAKGYTRG